MIAKVEADVVLSDVGAIAVVRDRSAARSAAAAVSQLLRQVPIVLLERREGQITATRWTAGAQQGADLPPGLVLSDAPAVLEDLLLGSVEVGGLDGVVRHGRHLAVEGAAHDHGFGQAQEVAPVSRTGTGGSGPQGAGTVAGCLLLASSCSTTAQVTPPGSWRRSSARVRPWS